ncbi:MAG: PQQ-like beta-propeller repeat protein [Verrucomicrobiales bacterium]|nr:PQQ-like beta-propeller repeat protein [Verrucomicrobiales bacterium]
MNRIWLFYLIIALLPEALADDWPLWRGPHHDGISREIAFSTDWPKEGPKRLWKTSVESGWSSAAISRGRLFTLGSSNATDTVHCIDAETGQALWKFTYPSPPDPQTKPWLPASTPTVDGDVVYTFSLLGQLFCFEALSGTVLWSKDISKEAGVKSPKWGFAGSPVVHQNLLIVNAGSFRVALDKTIGRIVWSSGSGPGGFASPVLFQCGSRAAAAIFSHDALVAVDSLTGKELWRFPWRGRVNIADPIVSGDTVFLSSAYGAGASLIRFGPDSAKVVWANLNMANLTSAPTIV